MHNNKFTRTTFDGRLKKLSKIKEDKRAEFRRLEKLELKKEELKIERKYKRQQKKLGKEREKERIQYDKDCEARIEKERIEKTGDKILYIYGKNGGSCVLNPFNLEEENKRLGIQKENSESDSIERWRLHGDIEDPKDEEDTLKESTFQGVHPFKPSAWKED